MCLCATARQPRGAALVIALLVMGVLLLAGATFLTISSTEDQIASNERAGTQALLVAEAALARGIAKLSADPSYNGEAGIPLANGSATITVAVATLQPCPSNTARDITATGAVSVQGGQALVQLRATVDRWYQGLFRWAAFSAVTNGVIHSEWDPYTGGWVDRTNAEVWLRDSSTTDSFDSTIGPYNSTTNRALGGDIGTNGDVLLNANAMVQGNIKAGDSIALQSGASATGLQVSSAQTESLPSVSAPQLPIGALTLPASGTIDLAAGTYYYTGMDFGDDSVLTTNGQVTIYVTGPVTIGHNVTMGAHPGTNLRIVTKSDGGSADFTNFVAGNNFRLFGSLYGRNTNISLGDHADLYGALISRIIAVGPHSSIHYDTALSQTGVCGGPGSQYVLIRGTWREVIP